MVKRNALQGQRVVEQRQEGAAKSIDDIHLYDYIQGW
jgi:hypothetical protein